jgi:hypothetical protein
MISVSRNTRKTPKTRLFVFDDKLPPKIVAEFVWSHRWDKMVRAYKTKKWTKRFCRSERLCHDESDFTLCLDRKIFVCELRHYSDVE